MKVPAFLLFFPALLLLNPLSWWLNHQHQAHFFLGLSSSFWAGVAIGISVVGWSVFIAFVVLYVYSARASLQAGHDNPEDGP